MALTGKSCTIVRNHNSDQTNRKTARLLLYHGPRASMQASHYFYMRDNNWQIYLRALFQRDLARYGLWGSVCLEPAALQPHTSITPPAALRENSLFHLFHASLVLQAEGKTAETHLRTACSLSSIASSASATPMERS